MLLFLTFLVIKKKEKEVLEII